MISLQHLALPLSLKALTIRSSSIHLYSMLSQVSPMEDKPRKTDVRVAPSYKPVLAV